MAVKLITNYAKRLGLPGYSSHQFLVSVETELPSLDNVRQESARLLRIAAESGRSTDPKNRLCPAGWLRHGRLRRPAPGTARKSNATSSKRSSRKTSLTKPKLSSLRPGCSACACNSSTNCRRAALLTNYWIVRATENEMDSGSTVPGVEPVSERGQQHDRGCRSCCAKDFGRGKPTTHDRGADPNSVGFALSTWQRCRLQFYFRYVAGIHKAPTPALHIGATIHTVLERWNLARWQAATQHRSELKQIFAQAWTIWQEGEQIEWNGEGRKIQIRSLECSATLPSQYSDYRGRKT